MSTTEHTADALREALIGLLMYAPADAVARTHAALGEGAAAAVLVDYDRALRGPLRVQWRRRQGGFEVGGSVVRGERMLGELQWRSEFDELSEDHDEFLGDWWLLPVGGGTPLALHLCLRFATRPFLEEALGRALDAPLVECLPVTSEDGDA